MTHTLSVKDDEGIVWWWTDSDGFITIWTTNKISAKHAEPEFLLELRTKLANGWRTNAKPFDGYPINDYIISPVMTDLKQHFLVNDSQENQLRRLSNPWTIQVLNKLTESWSDFCFDAPITLFAAEERVKYLGKDNPEGSFRVVPWMNQDQIQYVNTLIDQARKPLLKLLGQL